MKKRGFTLVELLAVIVIVSIIALITVPVILGMIEDSRKQAAAISGKEYVDYVNTRIVSDKLEDINFRDGDYDVYNDGREIRSSDQTMDIKMKGRLPIDGWIKIKNHQVVEAWLVFGEYEYHYILTDDGDIIQTITKVGEVAPDINLILQSTTNSITATVERKNQYRIKSYRFKLDDKEYHKSNNNQYIFTKLDSDKDYSVTVECINTTGGIVIVTSRIKTKDFDIPTYKIEPASGWATEKKVTITYPKKSNTFTNPIYEYKVGKDNEDLNNQDWLKADKNVFSYTFKENGVIVARVSDGNNYKTANSLSIQQIDNTPPTAAIRITSYTSKKVTVQGVCRDDESGIVRYRFRNGNGNWIDKGTTITHTFTDLPYNSNQTFYVECKNGSGLTKEANVSGKTCNLVAPTYSVSPSSGWATKKTVTITYVSDCGKNEYSLDGGKTWTTLTAGKNSATVEFNKTGSIIARSVINDEEFVNASTLSVSRIDTTGPDTTAPTVTVNNSSHVTVKNNQKDNESGIKSIKYYIRKASETNWTEIAPFHQGLDEATSYVFKTVATNHAGITTTSKESGTKTTCSISAPVIKVTSGNQYVVAPSKTVGVTFASNCGDTWKYEYSLDGGKTWKTTTANPFSYTFKENGSIIARVSDNSRTKTSSTLTLTDISPYIGLPNKTHKPGDYVDYAGEKWKVVKDNGTNVTLILAKNYTTAAGTYGMNYVNQFYNANASLQSEASNGGLEKHSETGSYVRLIKKDELPSSISNDSGTPFWTMSTDGTDSHASSIKFWYALSNGATSYTKFTTGSSLGLYRGYSMFSLTRVTVDTELQGLSVSTVAPSSVASVVTGSTYISTNIGYYSPLYYIFRPFSSSTISTYRAGTASMGASDPNCYTQNGKCICNYGTSSITNSSQKIDIAGQQRSQQYCSASGITSFNYTTPSLSWTAYGSKTGSSTTGLDTYNRCPGQVHVPVNFTCYSNCSSSATSSTTYYYAGTSQSACSSRTQYTVSETTSPVGVRPVITVKKRK